MDAFIKLYDFFESTKCPSEILDLWESEEIDKADSGSACVENLDVSQRGTSILDAVLVARSTVGDCGFNTKADATSVRSTTVRAEAGDADTAATTQRVSFIDASEKIEKSFDSPISGKKYSSIDSAKSSRTSSFTRTMNDSRTSTAALRLKYCLWVIAKTRYLTVLPAQQAASIDSYVVNIINTADIAAVAVTADENSSPSSSSSSAMSTKLPLVNREMLLSTLALFLWNSECALDSEGSLHQYAFMVWLPKHSALKEYLAVSLFNRVCDGGVNLLVDRTATFQLLWQKYFLRRKSAGSRVDAGRSPSSNGEVHNGNISSMSSQAAEVHSYCDIFQTSHALAGCGMTYEIKEAEKGKNPGVGLATVTRPRRLSSSSLSPTVSPRTTLSGTDSSPSKMHPSSTSAAEESINLNQTPLCTESSTAVQILYEWNPVTDELLALCAIQELHGASVAYPSVSHPSEKMREVHAHASGYGSMMRDAQQQQLQQQRRKSYSDPSAVHKAINVPVSPMSPDTTTLFEDLTKSAKLAGVLLGAIFHSMQCTVISSCAPGSELQEVLFNIFCSTLFARVDVQNSKRVPNSGSSGKGSSGKGSRRWSSSVSQTLFESEEGDAVEAEDEVEDTGEHNSVHGASNDESDGNGNSIKASNTLSGVGAEAPVLDQTSTLSKCDLNLDTNASAAFSACMDYLSCTLDRTEELAVKLGIVCYVYCGLSGNSLSAVHSLLAHICHTESSLELSSLIIGAMKTKNKKSRRAKMGKMTIQVQNFFKRGLKYVANIVDSTNSLTHGGSSVSGCATGAEVRSSNSDCSSSDTSTTLAKNKKYQPVNGLSELVDGDQTRISQVAPKDKTGKISNIASNSNLLYEFLEINCFKLVQFSSLKFADFFFDSSTPLSEAVLDSSLIEATEGHRSLIGASEKGGKSSEKKPFGLSLLAAAAGAKSLCVNWLEIIVIAFAVKPFIISEILELALDDFRQSVFIGISVEINTNIGTSPKSAREIVSSDFMKVASPEQQQQHGPSIGVSKFSILRGKVDSQRFSKIAGQGTRARGAAANRLGQSPTQSPTRNLINPLTSDTAKTCQIFLSRPDRRPFASAALSLLNRRQLQGDKGDTEKQLDFTSARVSTLQDKRY